MNTYTINKISTQFISSLHTIEQLQNCKELQSGFRGVVFSGRSNVGKSSLINSLYGKNVAKVSKTPGRTQSINLFIFKLKDYKGKELQTEIPLILFDLPGYGHAEVSKAMKQNWNKLMQDFFEKHGSAQTIISVQDARHPFEKSDCAFLSFLSKEDKSNTLMAFNKIDRYKNQKEKSATQKKINLSVETEKMNEGLKFFVSATTKQGVDNLEQTIISRILGL